MKCKIKTRESNIELLRIISMVMIILFHYVYKSNFQYSNLTINVLFTKSCWFFGELGVNLFVLITGYYLSKSKPSIKKIILLILEVLFYNTLNIIIGYKVGYINSIQNISTIFPIITGTYWFITAYLLIYILSPYYNKLINLFQKKEYQKFLLINLFIWSIIPTIFGFLYNSSESLPFYNRFIWLTFIYFVGAYIRVYNIKILDSKKRSLIISGITFLIMIFSIIIIYILKNNTIETAYFWTPNNIFMFILSISFFMLFIKKHIGNRKIINKISSTTLGIYLLHDGLLARYMWTNLFKSNIHIYSKYWFVYAGCSVIIIFIIGVVIDILRQVIEKKLVIKILDLSIWNKIYIKIKQKGLVILNKLL